MLTRTHMGVSLDGFVANTDGLPTWDVAPKFDPLTHGYREMMAKCDAVAMGRTSFDQGYNDWLVDWPWPGKRIFVLTSNPLPDGVRPEIVASTGGPARLVADLRGAGIKRDVHVLGGPRTIHALMGVGALDRLGIVLLPVLLQKGIPMFPVETTAFSRDAWEASRTAENEARPNPTAAAMRLEHPRPFSDGSIELIYAMT